MTTKDKMSYTNGRIYKVLNTIDDDIYVGSTCQSLSKRMALHRSDAKKNKQNTPFFMKMREHGVEHFYIELIEEFKCDTIEQLRQREGHYIREMGTLNKAIAGRSKKEYREENAEYLKEKKKEYIHDNIEKVREWTKAYQAKNYDRLQEYRKERYEQKRESLLNDFKMYRTKNRETINEKRRIKITCECGCQISIYHINKHRLSLKHIAIMKTKEMI